MIRALLISVSLLAATAPAFAQSGEDEMMEAGSSLEASMAAAQAAAARPGDEQLTCEAIQTEMDASMNDPAVQAQFASMGAWAQSQQERAEDARGQAMGMAGLSIMGSIASMFIPGAGLAQSLAMQAQMRGMEAQADQNQREGAAMMGEMETIMPQIMRGQRLYELAQVQQCAFLNDPSLAPPQ